jgi:hypothetical protein
MRESGQVATQAGANGRFSLEGLTADNLVGARSAAHAPSPLHLVRAAAGGVAELRIELLEPGHALAGSVVDEGGDPIADAEVEAGGGGAPWIDRNGLSAPPPPPQRTRSGPDGRFAFDAVPAGAVRVCARAPGRCATTTSVALDRRGLDDARIELAPEAIVVGTLRDHRGTPVHAASIRSGPYNGFTVSATTSEFDGSFRLRGLPAGAVELLAEHLDIGRTRATVTLLRGEERRWDPVLPAVPTISGSLTDEDGSPLEGWTVVAHHPALDASAWRFGPTRTDGTFRIAGLDANESYTLLVRDIDLPGRFPRRIVRDVVPSGMPYAIALRRDDPELAALVGTVVDGTGAAASGALLQVWHEELRVMHTGECDRDGKFEVVGVPPGAVLVDLRAGSPPARATRRVTVRAAESAELRIELLPPPRDGDG